jgi:16S rRNA (guanine527-N7)-methyltransferase
MTPQERLEQSLNKLGIVLDKAIQTSLLKFLDVLLRENEKINLTAIKTIDEGISKHLVDSLAALLLAPLNDSPRTAPLQVMDLGSGGGLPGMALALARPDIFMTLVESTKKKGHFLDLASAELGLIKRVKIEADRAEVLGKGPLRDKADVVTCRALGRLNVILELALPFLKVGGRLIAYKGPKADEELLEASKALKVLHAKLVEQKTFNLPFSDETRTLLVIEKMAPTPRQYPRLPGVPSKEPLCST